VTTVPFGTVSAEPLELLEKHGLDCVISPFADNTSVENSREHLASADYIIAGLHQFDSKLFDVAPRLKLIARVGVGVNNIDFDETKKRKIKVTYTPDAVTGAVAELVVGLIIEGQRRIVAVNNDLREGRWNKHMGYLLRGKTLGIIGVGRIGQSVIKLLQPFGIRILGNDIVEDKEFGKQFGFRYVDKDTIYRESDIISLNLSFSSSVKHLINAETLGKMKPNVYLINTARGSLVNEQDLYSALKSKRIDGASLDVFESEPYSGPLQELENVVLTAHIAAATVETRKRMELEATQEIIRFHRGEPLLNEIDRN